MTDNPNENQDQAPKNLSAEDVFAGNLNLTPDAGDIFAGGNELESVLEDQPAGGSLPDRSVTYQVQAPPASSAGRLNVTHLMVGVLTVAVIGLLLKPAPKIELPAQYYPPAQPLDVNNIEPANNIADSSDKNQNNDNPQDPVANAAAEQKVPAEPDENAENTEQIFAFEVPLSWSLAHELFTKKQYQKAHYVYKRLSENLALDDSQRDVLKDVLNLQMALCQFLDGKNDNLSSLLTVVLDSRSPALRALANYYLAFIDFRGKQYLSARSRAYRALASLEVVKEYFPESIEADCYFLLANALTCEVIRLNNDDSQLPGKNWSDTLVPYFLPKMTAVELNNFINEGKEALDTAVLEPIVKGRKGITAGQKYSVIANKSAAEEVIAKFASISKYSINWSENSIKHKRLPVTMFLSKTSGQEIPELVLGSLGLITRFDTDSIYIYNSEMETSFEKQKEMLTAETISAWQRFLLRYRGDHRSANAHFCLGMMRDFSGLPDVALGEYKILLSRYSNNSLAPFALLNSSKIKTNLRDYPGAKNYLKQLVFEYPNAKIADQAYLYLARANLSIQLYPEAFELFKKVYYVNLTKAAKSEAAFGAALSKFNLKDYQTAEKWFEKCFEAVENPPSIDVYKAYYYYGMTKSNIGKFKEAVAAYKHALAGDLTKSEYCKIVIDITETLVQKGDVLEAANLIENIQESSLPPKLQCDVVIAKSRIYTAMNLPAKGIMLLKQKIAYMADYKLRSMLMHELGRCYLAEGEIEKAYNEIAEAITDMSVGENLFIANNELAEICLLLDRDQQAVDICLGLLNSPNSKDIRFLTCQILGRAYKKQKNYKKAAEAFAGIYDKYEVSKND